MLSAKGGVICMAEWYVRALNERDVMVFGFNVPLEIMLTVIVNVAFRINSPDSALYNVLPKPSVHVNSSSKRE